MSISPGSRWIAASAAVLALACAARPASAQRDLYGMGGSSAGDARRQFIAEAREKVGALLAEYESAWGSRDLRALSGLYAGNATVYPAEGGMLTGRDAVREHFARLLPNAEPLRTQIVEFKAAGDLAFATVQVSYAVKEGAADRPYLGTDVVVLRRDWAGDWTIVTQFSRQEPGAMANTPRATAATSDSAGSQ
ncbi:nuclear transport factor 2 family protein [Longimicrobium sp.]|uniref:YybH family protein n=1 Tax=Longimicrobium sp. TaxID=2029185 RepID=UPI002B58A91C|nr:nuclear transport factor 2 family protein [Longimicrobium sp.]HSU14285.1 nuclear transport factor 2 family protein [Longimicrobium sp.]